MNETEGKMMVRTDYGAEILPEMMTDRKRMTERKR